MTDLVPIVYDLMPVFVLVFCASSLYYQRRCRRLQSRLEEWQEWHGEIHERLSDAYIIDFDELGNEAARESTEPAQDGSGLQQD